MAHRIYNIDSHAFNEYCSSLYLTGAELAAKFGRAESTVSHYRTGRLKVPDEVLTILLRLLKERAAHIGRQAMDVETHMAAFVGASAVFHNTNEQRERKPGFYNRVRNREQRDYEERTILAAYRITMPRLAILRQGLVALHEKLHDQLTKAPNSLTLTHALIDWKSVAGRVRGLDKVTPPFTMRPSIADWRILSAAIRLVPGDEAYAFYQHWRRHKGSGWPYRSESLQPKEES